MSEENKDEVGHSPANTDSDRGDLLDFEQLDLTSIQDSVEKMVESKALFDQIMLEMKEAIKAEAKKLADRPEDEILDAVERIRQEHKEKFRKCVASLGVDLKPE